MDIAEVDDLAAFLPSIVVLLQNVVSTMVEPPLIGTADENWSGPSVLDAHAALQHMDMIMTSVLHDFRLTHFESILGDELGYWVKPRSTTWFSQFLMREYDDGRWVENFRMSKDGVRQLSHILAPHLARKDTRYRKAIPVLVRVALALYKLTQGSPLLHVSETFAVGKSTASYIIKDFIAAVNIELRSEISWPRGGRLIQGIRDFKDMCGLPGVVGAIDGTHFAIRKPTIAPEDYYYFKSGGFSIQAQAVVDRHKRFIDISVGMPGSTNDVRVLRRSALFTLATTTNLFDPYYADEGFTPYLIGDKGYPLYPWLITPYRELPQGGVRSLQDRLFNRKLRSGRCVVENAFGILKGVFRELGNVAETHVTVVPDMVIACSLLHNLLLGQSSEEVARLLEVIYREGTVPEVDDDPEHEPPVLGPPNMDFQRGDEKRLSLGRYLAERRNLT